MRSAASLTIRILSAVTLSACDSTAPRPACNPAIALDTEFSMAPSTLIAPACYIDMDSAASVLRRGRGGRAVDPAFPVFREM
jgi:hypothetical protein